MSNGGTYMKLPAQTSRSEKWNVPISRFLRCRGMSRSSAETVLFPLFTLPSPPDTITMMWPLVCYNATNLHGYIAEPGDQKQEPPRVDFLNCLLGG